MKIGIIAAMDSEVALLKEHLIDKKEVSTSSGVFYFGKIGKHDVILSRCGIGKVSASLGVQDMISRYSPDCVINTGCAGGIAEGISIGDVVLSTFTAEWDMDTTDLGDPRGYISSIKMVEVPANTGLINAFKKNMPLSIKCHEGLIVSGDQFVSKEEQKQTIFKYFPHALCAEMEGAAVGHVCYQNNIPFVVVRCMSDDADSNSHVDYFTFVKTASQLSANVVINVLNNDIDIK